MSDESDNKISESENKKGIGLFGGLVLLTISYGFLKVGGWSLIWGKFRFTTDDFLLRKSEFAIRFNDVYYGAGFTERFFDSPTISWACLVAAFAMVGALFPD